ASCAGRRGPTTAACARAAGSSRRRSPRRSARPRPPPGPPRPSPSPVSSSRRATRSAGVTRSWRRSGRGGEGRAARAPTPPRGPTVALKLVRPGIAAQPDAMQRFRRELALAQEVTHPNVCRVHDLGDVEGVLYISMEYVDGQSLDDLIHSMGHLSARQTITLG